MKRRFEFSKAIVALVMLSYFAVLVFGIIAVGLLLGGDTSPYVPTALCGLFTYCGTAVASAIAFYCNKAKAENIEKIKGSLPKEENYV